MDVWGDHVDGAAPPPAALVAPGVGAGAGTTTGAAAAPLTPPVAGTPAPTLDGPTEDLSHPKHWDRLSYVPEWARDGVMYQVRAARRRPPCPRSPALAPPPPAAPRLSPRSAAPPSPLARAPPLLPRPGYGLTPWRARGDRATRPDDMSS